MSTAKNGDQVRVHYKGTLTDGTVFDSSHERGETINFKIGGNQLLPLFEKTVDGMKVGETREVDIPAAEGYGLPNPEFVFALPRDQFPEDVKTGDCFELSAQDGSGMDFPVEVKECGKDSITVDANHPLAGSDLHFSIELVEII